MNATTKQIVTIGIFGGIALAILLFAWASYHENTQFGKTVNSIVPESVQNEIEKVKPTQEASLVFAGDIMLSRGVATSVQKYFNNDFNQLFVHADYFKNADIAFANLEGPISDRGRNVGSKYSFRFDPKVAGALQASGLDVLSTANNHSGDWTIDAFSDTLTYLKEVGIQTPGGGTNKADAEQIKIIEKNGVKVGYLGFTDVGPAWLEATADTPGILLASDPNFSQIISTAKSEVDILVVSIHWGEEYKFDTHTTRQETLAHKAIDAGATIIAGHHPHVIEDVEYYKGGLILYSLGNYIFDQYFSPETMEGLLAFVTVDKKGITKTEFKTSVMNKKYQPEIIKTATAKGISTLPDWSKGYVNEEEPITKAPSTCEPGNPGAVDPFYLDVGRDTAIPVSTYVPADLKQVHTAYTGGKVICLRKDAEEHIIALIDAAKKDGLSIVVSSGFRSYETQKTILNYWLNISGDDAYRRIAQPGHSEHQLGTAVDLSGASIKNESATDKFEGTPEEIWLEQNAFKYGFVRSYPEGKESTTGYAYEPWHYRYVGTTYAERIRDLGTTINLFLHDLNDDEIGG